MGALAGKRFAHQGDALQEGAGRSAVPPLSGPCTISHPIPQPTNYAVPRAITAASAPSLLSASLVEVPKNWPELLSCCEKTLCLGGGGRLDIEVFVFITLCLLLLFLYLAWRKHLVVLMR